MGYKLNINIREKQFEYKIMVMRKLAMHAARNRVGYLRNRSVIEEDNKLGILNVFFNLLDNKYRVHNSHAFGVLLANKKKYDRVKIIKRSRYLRLFNSMINARLSDVWSYLRQNVLNRKRDRNQPLRSISRLVTNKMARTVSLGFEFIRKFSQLKKSQTSKPAVGEREQKLMA
jgi:hypothetical protein